MIELEVVNNYDFFFFLVNWNNIETKKKDQPRLYTIWGDKFPTYQILKRRKAWEGGEGGCKRNLHISTSRTHMSKSTNNYD